MVTEANTAGKPIVDREKTAPFLIRTFLKIGGFHRLDLFEDGALPTTDEQQIFTWRDATLREILTNIREVATHVPEYRHPLARFSFKAIYADSASRGRFSQKDLGTVYSRDILGEPGTLDVTAPRLVDEEPIFTEERTLEELRFVPGDYLCVAVLLPKGASTSNDPPSKGSANGWKSGLGSLRSDGGWNSISASGGGGNPGRGGGHWRGESNPHLGRGRASGRMGSDRGMERPRERAVDVDRRNTGRHDSPPRGGWGDHRRSPSRSRTPPKRRR